MSVDGGDTRRSSPLRRRLLSGDCVVGTFLGIPHAAPVEAMAGLGLDFVCVDAEHGGMSIESIHSVVRGADAAGSAAVVRAAGLGAIEIGGALDSGATGVIVPRIDTAAEAEDAVRFSRFPPHGARGLGPSRAARHGAAIGTYLSSASETVLVGVQVETAAAVDNIDAIVSVDGVDLIFVGPGDLSVSLGLTGPEDREELRAVISGLVEKITAAGRVAGIFAPTAADAQFWISVGVRFVLISSDVGFLLAGAQDVVSAMQKEMS